jgi:DNA-binding CsgD family transcriptional regulator
MRLWAHSALSLAVRRQGRYADSLEHARQACELTGGFTAGPLPLQPTFFLGLALYDYDRIAEARAHYRDAMDDELGSVLWHADILMAGAQAAFETAEWDDAAAGFISGAQVSADKGNQFLVTQALAYRAVMAIARGDLRGAGQLAAPVTAALEADPAGYGTEFFACITAGLSAAHGDIQRAYGVLLRSWRSDAASENRYYHRFLAPDLVQHALALGHPDVAREVADGTAVAAALAPEVPTVGSVSRRCQGLAGDDVESLLEAVELARRSGRLIEHTGACEDAAAMLARHGHRDDAARLWAEALDRYERAGADAWADRPRARLRALGALPRPPAPRRRPAHGWDSLTATERRIAHLVADGLTNRAVARELHISPHTVNTHLRHVFAKLSVSNRAALAATVAHSIGRYAVMRD